MPANVNSADCSPARQLNQGSRMKDTFDYSKVMAESKTNVVKKHIVSINKTESIGTADTSPAR